MVPSPLTRCGPGAGCAGFLPWSCVHKPGTRKSKRVLVCVCVCMFVRACACMCVCALLWACMRAHTSPTHARCRAGGLAHLPSTRALLPCRWTGSPPQHTRATTMQVDWFTSPIHARYYHAGGLVHLPNTRALPCRWTDSPPQHTLTTMQVDWFTSPDQAAACEQLRFKWQPGSEGGLQMMEHFISRRLPVFQHNHAKVNGSLGQREGCR